MQNNDESERIKVKVDPDIEELVPGFLENRRKDVNVIRAALLDMDFETVRILAHSMKGSGGGYGFDRITDIGRLMEDAAKQKNVAALAGLTEELKNYLDRIDVTYG